MHAVLNDSTSRPFQSLSDYNSRLRQLASAVPTKNWMALADAALNGEVNRELRRSTSIVDRRKFGVFFTGHELSESLLRMSVGEAKRFYDPTCGMGDLLLAAARAIGIAQTLNGTLELWSDRLAGTDLHPEFVDGAKLRLSLLAARLHRQSQPDLVEPSAWFKHITVGNALTDDDLLRTASHVLLNPPFGIVPKPENCSWTSGKVTAAAVFTESIIERSRPGTHVLSILPEVLRSGSFSEQWQKRIGTLAQVRSIHPYGIFDEEADIDVFTAHFVRLGKGEVTQSWPCKKPTKRSTVGNFFNINVGRVVPHRDPEEGPLAPYLHPRIAPPWKELNTFSEYKKHTGRLFEPPFVIVRRTSRPEHTYRATATIVRGNLPVAIENHLIVCTPLDKSLKSCRSLLRFLKSPYVNRFLNKRIRCRHLTVKAIAEIPFNSSKERDHSNKKTTRTRH